MATEEGTRLRQDVEDATDRFFDGALDRLDEIETEEMGEIPQRDLSAERDLPRLN